MMTKKRFQVVLLGMLGMAYQAPVLAAPFDVFWQKCRTTNTQAALDACDRAHDLRPWDPTVQKRGDDLFLILENQKKSGAPQPQRPPSQPVQPRRSTPDPFDAHWKKCRATNTQTALASCKQALNLRRNNATVRKRVNDLTQLLKPAPPPIRRVDPFDAQWRLCTARNTQSALKACTAALKLRPTNQKVRVRRDQLSKLLNPPSQPQRSPVVVQQPEPTPTPVADKPKVDKTVISRNQKILTQLGFDTGGTKGTIGNKTRKSVENFNQASGEAISSKLDDKDLVKLEAILARYEEAMDKYEVAKKEREDGNLSLALNTVKEAIQVVPWNDSLHSLEKTLEEEEKQKVDELFQELDDDFKELESLS